MQNTQLLNAVVNSLDDFKATNIVPLDVRPHTSVTDFMVIATGTSSRHVSAIAKKLIDALDKKHIDVLTVQADPENEWVLVDIGDVVIHIMQPQTREFYSLEKLWALDFESATAFA